MIQFSTNQLSSDFESRQDCFGSAVRVLRLHQQESVCDASLRLDIDEALDDSNRRIEHLARTLKCLGYFDDDPSGPRAA